MEVLGQDFVMNQQSIISALKVALRRRNLSTDPSPRSHYLEWKNTLLLWVDHTGEDIREPLMDGIFLPRGIE